MLRNSVALVRAWRDRGVGGCQNTAVHNLEVWFCKMLARSKCVAKGGACSKTFSRLTCRARVGTRGNAELVPPEICVTCQWYFAWQRVEVRLRKLEGEAFLRRELADLTKIQRSAALEVEPTQLLRKTPM